MIELLKKILPHYEKAGSTTTGRTCKDTQAGQELLSGTLSLKKQGNAFLAKGLWEEAASCYRQAISINPDFAEGFLNLGFALKEQRLFDEAERHLKRAIELNPAMTDAYYVLGTLMQQQGNLNGASANFQKALELKPDFVIVYRDLCYVLFQNGQYENAKRIIQQGIDLEPGFADFHYFLGNLYVHERKPEKAISCFLKALSIQPDHAAVLSNMGKACLELGRIGEAIDWYRKASDIGPSAIAVEASSSLLFLQSYLPHSSPSQYLADAAEYGKKVLAQARPYSSWAVEPTGTPVNRMRIGMVSGDLSEHPVGYFLENILKHLNPVKFELYAYPTQLNEDNLTARIKSCFAGWNPIASLSDEAAAQRIRSDGIHILIDLAGHTTHNRLPVFAWKPAPIQVSWLGYFASTGVPGMDYFLADKASLPESNRKYFTETICYLPDTRLCFSPPANGTDLELTPPPSLKNGHITFGCFQNIGKVNDEVLSLWGNIFRSLPQARLRLQCKQMDFASVRSDMLQRLANAGIMREQVTIVGSMPRMEYLAAHAEVDIILDTFPYPGGTTTCEALWMGVPTLTLAGNTMLSRQGASILACAGLTDWITDNSEDYVTKALTHASDSNRLAQLRSSLRQDVLVSPLFNASRFVQHLEDAFLNMWLHSSTTTSSSHHV